MSAREIADDIEEKRDSMLELLDEIEDLLSTSCVPDDVRSRAETYWVAHVRTALTKEHEYLSASMCDADDTLEELREELDDED